MKRMGIAVAGIAVLGLFAMALGASARAQQGRQGAPPPAPPQTAQPAPPPAAPVGYTDTPMLPGLPWHVHDPARPHPRMVTPGAVAGAAPADAIVLFDGKDLSRWGHRAQGAAPGAPLTPAAWPVRDGYFEVGKTDLYSRDSFGDAQIHLEWAAPAAVSGSSQNRGNSGLKIMGLYELQILDSYDNITYADGQAAAIYGQWPPLVNATRKPGEWQTYDVIFEAPRFDGDKVAKPAYLTVFWNGVMVHVHKELIGTTLNRQVGKYTAHAAELPLMLQDHNHPVRYRNIWVRKLTAYDQPEK